MEEEKPKEEETLCHSITKRSKCFYHWICDNKIILSLFVIYLLFHSFFEKLINDFFVEAFFSSLEPSIINDIIFACLLVLIIIPTLFIIIRDIVAWKNNQLILKKSISNKYLLISIIILLIIGYYRFFYGYWYYTSIKTFDSLKYIDIILLYIISTLLILISNHSFYFLLKRKQNNINDKEKGFCFDDPIKKSEDDLLNRDSVAKNIAYRIINTVKNESSFAIGITSEWGNGKTSFLNIIEQHLPKKDRIIIHFNPWLNNDEKTIVSTFFNELSIELKDSSPKLSSDIIKYSEILSSVYSNELSKLISTTLSISNNDTSLIQRFDNINSRIKKLGLQIVILVDDLDRLYENEVLEVLRLIRNSANFSNTIFVVAYDKNYIVTAIKRAINYHPDLYLEKIFQLEIALPEYEESIIKNEIEKRLTLYLNDKDKKELKRILELKQNIAYGNYFDYSLLTNLRDISRFVNSFLVSYEALKGECYLLDLLNLELFRIKYLGAYNLFAKDYNQFLTTTKNRNKNEYYVILNKNENKKIRLEEQNAKLEQIQNNNVGIEKNQKTKFEKALNNNIGIEKKQIEDILKYVYNIFPDYSESNLDHTIELLSIANPISINRYFHYNLLKSDLSEIEFSKYRQKPLKEFEDRIKEWVDNGFSEGVKRKFEYIELYSDKDDYEKIINAILFLAELPNESDQTYHIIDYYKEDLVREFDYFKVDNYYTKEEFHTFVLQLFEKRESPYTYVSLLMNHIFNIRRFNGWEFILTEEELKTLKLKFFKDYSEKTTSFDSDFYRLYDFCYYNYWEESPNNSVFKNKKIIDGAKDIFKTSAKRLPESFVKSIIKKGFNPPIYTNKLYCTDVFILDVWGNWDNFDSFINEIEESEWIIEFKDFYTKCKEEKYEKYIEYEFKELKIN